MNKISTIMSLVSSLKFRIDKISANEIQKNILSFLYCLWAITIFAVIISILVTMFLDFLFNCSEIFNYIFKKQINDFVNNQNLYYDMFIKIIDFKQMFKYLIPILITIIYVYFFDKYKFKREFFYLIINIFITMRIFLNLTVIFFIILVIFLILIIVPINSGKYYKMIKKIRYFIDACRGSDIKMNRNNVFKIILKYLFISFICFLLAIITSKYVSIYFGFLFYITFVFKLRLDYYSYNKIFDLLVKIILYILVICAYIYLNRQLTGETNKLIALIITMYFSWDRLFSVLYYIDEIIYEKSTLYYYEEEKINIKIINKKILNINLIDKKMDEIDLLIQILMRFNVIMYNKNFFQENCLQFIEEISLLSNFYEKLKYKSYYFDVKLIYFFVNDKKISNLEINKLYECFVDNYSNRDLSIVILSKYIELLFMQKEYKKINDLYESHLKYYLDISSEKILKILNESAKRVN